MFTYLYYVITVSRYKVNSFSPFCITITLRFLFSHGLSPSFTGHCSRNRQTLKDRLRPACKGRYPSHEAKASGICAHSFNTKNISPPPLFIPRLRKITYDYFPYLLTDTTQCGIIIPSRKNVIYHSHNNSFATEASVANMKHIDKKCLVQELNKRSVGYC